MVKLTTIRRLAPKVIGCKDNILYGDLEEYIYMIQLQGLQEKEENVVHTSKEFILS